MKALLLIIAGSTAILLAGIGGNPMPNGRPALAITEANANGRPSIDPSEMIRNAPLDLPDETWNPF